MRVRLSLGVLALVVGLGLAALLAGVGGSTTATAGGSSQAPDYNLAGTWDNEGSGATIHVSAMNMTTGAWSGTGTQSNGSAIAANGTEADCTSSVTETFANDPGVTLNGTMSLTVLPNGNLSGNGTWTNTDGDSGTINIEQVAPADGAPTPASNCASAQGGTATSGTQVVCNDVNPGQAGDYDQCTATVGGSAGAGGTDRPTGTVLFNVNPGASGGFNGSTSTSCTLSPSEGGNTSYCSVDYAPATGESQPPITASYPGDANFAPSSGAPNAGTDTDTTTTATATATTTTTTSKIASATQVSCNQEIPESEEVGEPGIAYLACTATVSGTNGTGVVPSGSVTFKDVGSTPSVLFEGSKTCALTASTSGPTAYCTVNILPSANPIPTDYEPPILATYSGDANFGSSSASPQLGPGPDDADNPEDPVGQDNPTDPNGANPTVDTAPVTVTVNPPASGPTTVTTSGGGSSTIDTSSWTFGTIAATQVLVRSASAAAGIHWLVCKRTGTKLVCSLGTLAAHEKVKVHLLLGFTPAAAGQTKHLSVIASETVKGKVKTLAHQTITVKVPKRTVLSVALSRPKTTGGAYTAKVKNAGVLAATKLRVCFSGTDGLTPLSAPGAKLSKGVLCLSDTSLARGKSLSRAVKVRGSGVLEAVVSAGNARSVTVGV